MRIFVVSLDRKGAGPLYAYEACRALSKKNEVSVAISSFCEIKEKWDELQKSGAISLFEMKTYRGYKEFFWKTSFLWKSLRGFWNFFDSQKPDAVYYGMGHTWESFLDKGFQKR